MRIHDVYAALERRTQARPLARGLAVGFTSDARGEQARAELRERFAASHPAFTATPADGCWLHLEGPEGAREYLEGLLETAARLRSRLTARHRWRWRGRRATAALRALPDFLILGAARCGTTALYRALASHPQVEPAWRKEVAYLDRGMARGIGWYRAHFPLKGVGRVTGEATPEYLFHPHAPQRARALMPRARLIALLREPVERAWSQHQLHVRNGFEKLPFEEAVAREEERTAGELERMLADERYESRARHYHAYLARGLYADQVAAWLAWFPREQMLVLESEDLRARPKDVLARVARHLGIEDRWPVGIERAHTLPRAPLAPATRERLEAWYAPQDRRLAGLIGRAPGWLTTYGMPCGENSSC